MVPPSREQQAEQVLSTMEVVTDYLCSRETPRADDVTKGGLSRLSVILVVVVVSAWTHHSEKGLSWSTPSLGYHLGG